MRLAVLATVLSFLAAWLRRAAGRLAPKLTIAPLVFLVTRGPVLGVALAGTLGWAALLLPGAMARGNDDVGTMATLTAISLLCGFGVAALVVGPVFMVMRAFAPKPELALASGETVVHEEAANHWLGGESRGGRLLITNRRLGFRPHRFNVQLQTWSTPLETIDEVTCEGQRLVGVHVEGTSEPVWFVSMSAEQLAQRLRAT